MVAEATAVSDRYQGANALGQSPRTLFCRSRYKRNFIATGNKGGGKVTNVNKVDKTSRKGNNNKKGITEV